MEKVEQGTVILKRVTTTPGAEPWDPPSETAVTYPLKAAAESKNQSFERGTLIQEAGSLVTFAVPTIPASVDPAIPANTPVLTDTIVVNGRERTIKALKPIPEAGTVCAWQAFLAV
jgi:hypothetical protein